MLICGVQPQVDQLPSRVVSTKLSEEEYGKLVGLVSASGYTVSKLLKRAILERMKEEPPTVENPSKNNVTKNSPSNKKIYTPNKDSNEDRFLYY